MFLTNPFPNGFGLDIGDLSIKLVQLREHTPLGRAPYFELVTKRSATLPAGAIINGEIVEPEIVRQKLLLLLEKNGKQKAIRSPWVVADLPETKTFLKLIDVKAPAAELNDELVVSEAKQHVPFDIEDTYLDWQIIKATDKPLPHTLVLVGAAPKVVADSYTYLLEAAGLTVLALEMESLAIARSLITKEKDYTGMARAILDIGASRSSLIIYDNDSIQFSTLITFSGETLTLAIAEELAIDYAAAERLKIANGLQHDREHPKYLKVVAAWVDSLIAEIRQVLLYYREHFADTNPVTHITLCGGMAALKNMDAVISQKLKISTHPGNVWKNILTTSVSEQEKAEGLPWATALGLAMRAAINPLKDD